MHLPAALRFAALLPLVLATACDSGDAGPAAPPPSAAARPPRAAPPATSVAAPHPTAAATPAPAASASAAPAASAALAAPAEPAASAAPAAPDPAVDCDALLSAAEVAEACGVAVEQAPEPADDIGQERTCSRRFQSKEAGALSFLLIRHASPEETRARFQGAKEALGPLPDFKELSNLGDAARQYTKKGASGDPVYTVEVVKGRFLLALFNSKVTLGGETIGPVCSLSKLGKIAAAMVGELP